MKNSGGQVRLGDVCTIDASMVDPKDRKFRELPHVYGGCIESGTGRLLDVHTAAEDKMISGKYLFDERHVIYSKLRPYLRKVVFPGFKGLCSADAYPLTLDPARVHAPWLVGRLLARDFTAFAIEQSKGRARIPKINREELLAWSLHVPPLDEQRRIAAHFGTQMSVVSLLRTSAVRARAAASGLRFALMRQAFGENWPLSFAHDLPTSSTLPASWAWVSLPKVAKLRSGHTPSRYKPGYWEGGNVPWISLSDVTGMDDFHIHDTKEHPTMEGIQNSAATMLPAGTVVLSRTASLGHSAIMGREMATSQDFANWICGPDLDPLFLLFVFRGSLPVLRKASDGATHKTIYMPTIKRAKIILPPRREQQRLVQILSDAWEHARTLEASTRRSSNAMEALLPSVLDATFTGEREEN